MEALERVRKVRIFEGVFERLNKENLIVSGDNDIEFSFKKRSNYIEILSNALIKINAVMDLIEKHVPKENKDSVAISIPSYESLEELASMENSLSTLFKMLSVSEAFKEKPTFEHFDVGSDWLLIKFISTEAVRAFSIIIKLISSIKRKNIESRIVDAWLQSLELSEKTNQEVRDKTAKVH